MNNTVTKNIFTNYITFTPQRFMYNAVDGNTATRTVVGTTTGDLALITDENLNSLKYIEIYYGRNLANKTYEMIPNDYSKYIQLYYLLSSIQIKVKDEKLSTLLKLAEEALKGAINIYTIYGDNIAIMLEKLALQKTLDDILSKKNEHVVAEACGQLSIKKSFKLAPVFSYYITVYGLPAFGVGFDPLKINFLADVLTRHGINPYK